MSKMDIDYEYEELGGGARKRVVVQKKGGLLGKIVALFLGFVLGVVASVGGVIGVGYYAVTQVKIQDAVDSISGMTGFEFTLSDYLTEEYSQNTLLNLVQGVGEVGAKIGEGTGTLNDLKAISPYVATLVNGTDGASGLTGLLASYGIDVDGDELMGKYIVKTATDSELNEKYLFDYLLLKLNDMPVGDLLEAFGYESNVFFTTVCYGVEDVDYKIVDGEYVMLGDSTALTLGELLGSNINPRLEKLPLDAVTDVKTTDLMMCTLAYGAPHRYTVNNGKVEMNQLFYTYEGGQFYTDNGDALSLVGEPVAVSEQPKTYLLTFSNGVQHVAVKTGEENRYYAFTANDEPQIVRFQKTTLADLQDDSAKIVDQITLKDALGINETSHSVLYSIAFDGDRPRTIGDLRTNSGNIIDGIALTDVIPADTSDAVVMYLLYGKENVHYSVHPTTKEITPLQKRVALYDGKVFNEYGEEIKGAQATGTSAYILDTKTYTLVANPELGTIPVKIVSGTTTVKKNATVYYVQENGANVYYKPTTIGDMQNGDTLSALTNRVLLKDVLEVGNHKLLKHLENEAIADLPDAINALTIDDAFGDQFYYRTTKGDCRLNENGEPIDSKGNIVAGAKLIDIHNAETTNKDEALTGTWKYLLMDRKADGTFTINHHHTITEIDSMMDYMSNNVHSATVRELKLDGIIKNLEDDTLNKVIIGEIHTLSGTKAITIKQNGVDVRVDNLDGDLTDEDRVGDLTVEQLMLYMGAMLDVLGA